MRIAVAGGGIAGLAAAVAFSRRGFEVEVHERAPEPREIGAGVQLSPNGMTVLARLGLEADILKAAIRIEAIEVRDGPSARLLARIPLGDARQRYGASYCVIRRADLHTILLGAAQNSDGVHVRFGSEITAAASDTDGVTFTAGATCGRADLLVGADGVSSRLRTEAFGLGVADSVGKTAWRATIPARASAIDAAITGLWLGRGAHLVHYPVDRAAAINVVMIGDSTGSQEPPLSSFADSPLRAIHKWSEWTRWPLQVAHPPKWVCGRMVLIGDAAHALLPSAAQGGAQALEDAWFLARAVASHPLRLPAALLRFEASRRPRIDRIARESRRNLAIYNTRGIAALARNSVISAIPGSLHRSRLDWLYRLPVDADSA